MKDNEKESEMAKKKSRTLDAARRRLQKKYPSTVPGQASKYIRHLDELIKEQANLKVVLFIRVSTRGQSDKGNLKDQLASLRKILKKHGISIVGVIRDLGSGWRNDKDGLQYACEKAIELGAVVLAESTDRLLRSVYYHSVDDPYAKPSTEEYEDMLKVTNGATLVTVVHPDADLNETRSYHTKRGQQEKGRKGGRPKSKAGYKKQERKEKLPKVLELREKGRSYREIEKRTGVKYSTAYTWVHKYS